MGADEKEREALKKKNMEALAKRKYVLCEIYIYFLSFIS